MGSAPAAAFRWKIEFDRVAQVKAALVAIVFVALFWPLLDFNPAGGFGEMTHRWVHEGDWSHGPLIPLFSAYLVYLRWDRIRRAAIRYTWVGLLLIIFALALYQYSIWGFKVGYIRPVAMMICLFGVVVLLCGLPVMRYAWLPWVYLFFAIPIPRRYYFFMTDPLQKLAAAVSCAALDLAPGLEMERTGFLIHPIYHGQSIVPLSVTDACSGMRSTMVLCALGVAVAFVTWRPLWQRVILIASCVPIATFCNAVRVTATSALHIFVDPRYATGTYHTILGLVIMLLATGIFLGLGWLLNHMWVEDAADGEEPELPARPAGAPPVRRSGAVP